MVTDAPGAPERSLSVVIRADASTAVGTGHVQRCLGLAEELRVRGHRLLFISRAEPGHLIDLVRERGFPCHTLSGGLSPQEDAEATAGVLSTLDAPPDSLIVDSYALDAEWERVQRPRVSSLIAIDDLADRSHDVDVLLDASQDEDAAARYRQLVPERTTLLLGARYLLLRREFFEREPPLRLHGPVRRILVTFGGNDPLDMTSVALRALSRPDFAGLDIDVTLGTSNPRRHAIQAAAASLTNVAVHLQHPRPSVLMEAADLCLGAGGTTMWERCYLGLPSLVVVLAENQRGLAARMDRLGAARSLGDGRDLSEADLARETLSATRDTAWRTRSSRAGQMLVDGQGIARVVAVLESEAMRATR